MNLTAACLEFENDIHLFVDHELPADQTGRLSGHLDRCEGCTGYMDDLRRLATLNIESGAAADAALADLVDRHALFASVTRELMGDKRLELARLFYELGKAYVLKANTSMSGRLSRTVASVSRPVDIRSTMGRGRQLAREAEDLEAVHAGAGNGAEAGSERESGSLFQRSRRLFSSSTRAGSSALSNGRRLLEESLRLEPALSEARLYLGLHHMLTGRFDRARLEFRRVYREGVEPVHRMMALQMLGNVHSAAYDLERAVRCYEEVVQSDLLDAEPKLASALVNLGVNYAKLGRVGAAIQAFTQLVDRFPQMVGPTRSRLRRKQDFVDLLEREDTLAADLRVGVPALFAA